jgi:hypothetical protein
MESSAEPEEAALRLARAAYSPSTSGWCPPGGHRATATARRGATAPRSRPRTLQVTSMRRDAALALDHVGRRLDEAPRPRRRAHGAPRGVSIGQLAHRREVGAHGALLPTPPRPAPAAERYTSPTRSPLEQRRRRAANLPGVSPKRRAAAGSTRTSICGTSTWASTLRSPPRDVARGRADVARRAPERAEVGAEEAHHDGAAGAREHLLHALLEVGLHVAVEAGVAVDRRRGCAPPRGVVDVRGRG